MTNKIENIEHEIASSSYRADHHEENELVINSFRVVEILNQALASQKSALIKSINEGLPKGKEITEKLKADVDNRVRDWDLNYIIGYNQYRREVKAFLKKVGGNKK